MGRPDAVCFLPRTGADGDMLCLGMRLKQDIDAGIRIPAGDAAYTSVDRALPGELVPQPFWSRAVREMKVE